MNVVFYCSEPSDLRPLYPDPVPLETAVFSGHSVFGRAARTAREFFPDARFFLWCGSPVPFETGCVRGLDVLTVPTRNAFAMVFFFSSFSASEGLNSFTLYYPARLLLEPFESFAVALRGVLANPMLSTAFTFYSARSGVHPFYLQKGDCVFEREEQRIHHVLDIRPASDVALWKEKHPDRSEWDVFLGGADLFSVNRTAFTEALEEAPDRLKELYFSLSDPGPECRTHLPLGELEKIGLRDFLKGLESVFVTETPAAFDRYSGTGDLLRFLPLDESGNYAEGRCELTGVTRTIAVNRDADLLRLENVSGLLVCRKDGECRVRGLAD